MTRLYDTITERFISSEFPNGYFVDGVKPDLPDGIVELTIIQEPMIKITERQKTESFKVLDLEQKTYTYSYNVVDLTPKEIEIKRNQEADFKNQEINTLLFKEIARTTVKDLENNIDKYLTIYDYYKVGREYKKSEIIRYENELYEIIQAHTSQYDWYPDALPALYKKVRLTLSEWVQPQGAHDAYQIGDIVLFQNNTYENTTANNVWSPITFGWKII